MWDYEISFTDKEGESGEANVKEQEARWESARCAGGRGLCVGESGCDKEVQSLTGPVC